MSYSKFTVVCPECGNPTRVTRTLMDRVLVRRERQCSNGHKFETLEKQAKPRKRLTPREAAAKRWA